MPLYWPRPWQLYFLLYEWNLQIKSHITCNTFNVIYVIQCRLCNLQYIGKTSRVSLSPRAPISYFQVTATQAMKYYSLSAAPDLCLDGILPLHNLVNVTYPFRPNKSWGGGRGAKLLSLKAYQNSPAKVTPVPKASSSIDLGSKYRFAQLSRQSRTRFYTSRNK